MPEARDAHKEAKSFVTDYLGRNAEALNQIIDALFWYGEPAMQEVRSAALLTKTLEDAGFKVERGISGFPTGFVATFGSGKPVVADCGSPKPFSTRRG